MGSWRKLGLMYCPTGGVRHSKHASHAANPLPVHVGGNIYRVFFSGRDAQSRSSVCAVDVDICERRVVHDYFAPFFQHGPTGSFYADGVSIGNCYEVDGIRYMLFMGWQNPLNDHWRGDIGRLVVERDLSLRLDSTCPFMSCDQVDPVSLSYPWVLKNESGGYDMWYGSTVDWDVGNGEMLHVINYAQSVDGHNWSREGLAIPYSIGTAQAFSRPTVAATRDGGFEMWFSYRGGVGSKYRIGYAASEDGRNWDLALDSAGIDVSAHGWDSDMIEYPFVFHHEGIRYMLYNGNGFGETGFGLAVWE